MINQKEFVEKQKSIYENSFDAKSIAETGILPSNAVNERDGYLVVLRHPTDIVERVSSFTDRIAEVVPVMPYTRDNTHTTIFAQGMQHRPASEHSMDQRIIDQLSESITEEDDLNGVTIPYQDWLYNKDSVIVKGIAGVDFVGLANKVLSACSVAKGPWGGHITSARFTNERDAEGLYEFFDLMDEAPEIGTSNPEYLDVVYVQVEDGKVSLETQERFSLVY